MLSINVVWNIIIWNIMLTVVWEPHPYGGVTILDSGSQLCQQPSLFVILPQREIKQKSVMGTFTNIPVLVFLPDRPWLTSLTLFVYIQPPDPSDLLMTPFPTSDQRRRDLCGTGIHSELKWPPPFVPLNPSKISFLPSDMLVPPSVSSLVPPSASFRLSSALPEVLLLHVSALMSRLTWGGGLFLNLFTTSVMYNRLQPPDVTLLLVIRALIKHPSCSVFTSLSRSGSRWQTFLSGWCTSSSPQPPPPVPLGEHPSVSGRDDNGSLFSVSCFCLGVSWHLNMIGTHPHGDVRGWF